MIRLVILVSFGGLLAFNPAVAQSSASYKLEGASINAGGNPMGGGILTSSHFHIRLDSMGDDAPGIALASTSFLMNEGFVGSYPPPGNVQGLGFGNATTLQWNPDGSAARYEIYRGPTTSLPGSFGACYASDVLGVTATDTTTPPLGQAFFYLVTARNRLGEEGPKGFGSNGTVESNPSPCP